MRFETIILGAGPAGTGPLVSALRRGLHTEFLARGVLWIDRQQHMGQGSLGKYAIGSDTAAHVLLECLRGDTNPLASLAQHEVAAQVRAYGGCSLPLSLAAAWYKVLGERLEAVVTTSGTSAFIGNAEARAVLQQSDDRYVVVLADGRSFAARNVVFAMGGKQLSTGVRSAHLTPDTASLSELVDGDIMLTDEIVAHGGMEKLLKRLPQQGARVGIIGSSHSAATMVTLLLNSGVALAPGAVTWAYRRAPKVFYPTRNAAHADNYTDFDDADICPVTGRVFRLAGLRMAARDTLRRALGLGGLLPDPRLALLHVEDALPQLRTADVVIPAFGYRPNTVLLVNKDGKLQGLNAHVDGKSSLVNDACEVLDGNGRPLINLFGVGLASGFIPRGPELGGEPSFVGRTNGLWLYQHDVGDRLYNQLMVPRPIAVAR